MVAKSLGAKSPLCCGYSPANYARLGQPDKATERVQQLLKGEPTLTISKQRSRMMFMDVNVWNKLADGLRLAGLPE